MSWLFGSSRKKKEEPFVFVEAEEVAQVTAFEREAVLYPSLPQYVSPIPAMGNPPIVAHDLHQSMAPPLIANPLDSIPFKFSSKLEGDNSNAANMNELYAFKRFFQMVDQSLNSRDSVYSFDLERSVLHEANLFNGA